MLKKLQIKNFKGWSDTHEIKMAPITLFFGANSSGKSSIGQLLMLLKQTAETSDRKSVFNYGNDNTPVRLGSFFEMVHKRDKTKKIQFKYQWELNSGFVNETLKDTKADLVDFECEVGQNEKDFVFVNQIKYELLKESESKLSIVMSIKDENQSQYEVKAANFELKKNAGRQWPIGTPVRFYGFPDEAVAYHQNADFIQELNLSHEKFFQSIFYLGPMRTKAERIYIWTKNQPDSVGYEGEHTIPAILAAKERKIGIVKRGKTKASQAKAFHEIIATKLLEMELIDAFEVKPIADNRQEYEVRVKTRGSLDYVDLPDVGFGISQVLPVLVQCFYAPRNSIIIMEQPEIHLHPNAQAILADVMIDAIHSKEDGKDRNIQLIIETHSEHFLRRLQRRIAEDTLKDTEVSAYFANTVKNKATLTPLEIDIFGNISNWPENFFGDEMGDITSQAKAALKRRIDQ